MLFNGDKILKSSNGTGVIPKDVETLLDKVHHSDWKNQISDLQAFLETHVQTIVNSKDRQGTRKKPIKSDNLYEARKLDLEKFALIAGIKPCQFAENLMDKNVKYQTENKQSKPESVAFDFIKPGCENELAVLSSVCILMAYELAGQPYVR